MTILATAPAAAPTAPERHITSYTPLPTPAELLAELPLTAEQAHQVAGHRDQVRAVLEGTDRRLLVVVGPCSIHDPEAGLDYARRLAALQHRHAAVGSPQINSYYFAHVCLLLRLMTVPGGIPPLFPLYRRKKSQSI